ncbi:MAG: MotA/TolQ/ExbB proton channel family protein [Planctomycetes bacterium]|nr:MotA/TolQ/ExbB proton channel family protein [Planctomycetota bacterium]
MSVFFRRLLAPALFLLLCSACAVAADDSASVAPSEPVSTGEAAPAGAKAAKVDIVSEGLFHWPMIPLWLVSFAMVACVFERARALRSRTLLDQAMVDEVVEHMGEADLAAAQATAEASDTVVGRAWGTALHEFSLGGVGLQEAMVTATTRSIRPLKRRLPAIATMGVISPLLGLFATVIGIIISFGQMGAEGGADKAQLARAIGVALFGTAGGIIIAVPAIVAGRYFLAKINGVAELADAAIGRMNLAYSRAVAELDAAGKR